MAPTPGQRLCALVRQIVSLLEGGDSRAAAEEAAGLPALVASLPAQMAPAEVEEARGLLERYAALGEKLRQDTLAATGRLESARRVAAYARLARR